MASKVKNYMHTFYILPLEIIIKNGFKYMCLTTETKVTQLP